MHLNPAAV